MSALANVRVLDLTRFLAGPFCTAVLADLGADVVKVEAPRGGDEGRYGYPTADGVPVFFLALNRNKRGITLSLRTDEGRALLRRLLPHFDVLVENFAGGTLRSWGLDPATLVAEHPRLIVLGVMRRYGPRYGLWSGFTSYDPAWIDSVTRLVQQLRGTGAKVLVLGPIPDPLTSTPDCLSVHLDDANACSPRQLGLSTSPKAGYGIVPPATGVLYSFERCFHGILRVPRSKDHWAAWGRAGPEAEVALPRP